MPPPHVDIFLMWPPKKFNLASTSSTTTQLLEVIDTQQWCSGYQPPYALGCTARPSPQWWQETTWGGGGQCHK